MPTCISYDYCFEDAFARQIQAQAQPEDVFIGISTKGNSKNILGGMAAGAAACASTMGLTGGRGWTMKESLAAERLAEICLARNGCAAKVRFRG